MFRLKIIRLAVIFLFLTLSGSLFFQQIVKGRHYFDLSQNNSIRLIPIESRRGKILDRHGVILADSELTFNVSIIKQDISDKDELFLFLSDILKKDVSKLEKKFKRNMLTPFAPVVVADDVNRQTAIVIAENMFRFPGLLVQESYRRVYPYSFIGSHVLGYVSKPNEKKARKLKKYGYSLTSAVGYTGVEEYYQDFLTGVEGGRQIEVNSRGRKVRLLSLKESRAGQDIKLTIDQRIQQKAFELLGSSEGSILVMDLDNGELLSLVSMPSFNPNDFIEKKSSKKRARYIYDHRAPLLNRAISGQYPPGSVFKIPMALAALQTKSITPKTTYYSPGYMEVGGQKFRSHVVGYQDLYQAIAKSDNVYFFHIGIALGAENISKWARYFGLGNKTNIDLPFEKVGFVPSKDSRRWYKGDTLNFSIGQGDLLTTPAQLLSMMSLVANDGKMVQPHLLYQISNNDFDQYDLGNRYRLPVKINQKYFDDVKQGMRRVVSEYAATAYALNISGLDIRGKTGTAQAGTNKQDHSWFVGYVEQSSVKRKKGKRRIAFCVFLEHGGSSYNAVLLSRELMLELRDLNYI